MNRTLHDPIAMEVFSNRLLSITEDMNNTLVRSSFSTNIKERRDCSVGLFDGRVPPRLVNPEAYPRYAERFAEILGFQPDPLP